MNYKKLIACLCVCCISGCITPYTVHPSSGFAAASSKSAENNNINFTAIGQYTEITLTGTTETPTWYSDNTAVATVDSSGKVTAVGEGTASVYAVFSNQVITFNVTVTLPEVETDIEIGTIYLSNENPGVTVTLSGVDLTGAVWTSSDTSVATVDSAGVVTAVGSGSCTITASVGGKNYIASVSSTYVKNSEQQPVTEVILGQIELTNENNAAEILLSNIPDDAVISWSSSDESVAVVDDKGVVTAVGSGECRIIALIEGVSYITEITSTYIPQETVTEKELGSMELTNEAPSVKINLSNVPEGAEIVWSSSDESVAVVDDEGVVTAVGSGTCKVTALINGINYIMNVTSSYTPQAEPEIAADSTVISGIGNTLQLSIINSSAQPQWISTDVNVAVVDENGLVTAVGAGEVVIIAQIDGKVCSVTITVTDDVEYGDADLNGKVELNDAVLIMCYIADEAAYPMNEQQKDNADVYQRGDGVNNMDALAIQKKLAQLIPELPESYM